MTENTVKEIKRLQNIVALEELKRHYDKSEWARVMDDLDYQPTEAFTKLQGILDEEYTGDMEAKLSNLGTITIMEKYENHLIGASGKRVLDTIMPTVQLPYAYVMGKKIGKKVTQSILEKYGMTL